MEARRDRRADGILRGFTAGLIEELTEWFTDRFDKIRDLNFETCPGELRCSTKAGARIHRVLKREPDKEIERICADCRFLPTKPGREPAHLSHAIWIANQLDEDGLICEGFDYPAILDYLDPLEWACLIAIKTARRNSENKSLKEPPQKAEREQHIAHLKQLSHS